MEEAIIIKQTGMNVYNFSMQQNYVPLIRNIVLENHTQESIAFLTVEIQCSPEFAKPYRTSVAVLNPGELYEITPVKLMFDTDFLLSLRERMLVHYTVRVLKEEEVLASNGYEIELLAYDEWGGSLVMPELLASFVMPNVPGIPEILANAGLFLQKWTGNPAFTGYQKQNPSAVKMQMGAIYAALQKEMIAYTMPPASFERCGQKIRLPYEVLEQKAGTCLDLAVLYASLLEQVGIHPLLCMAAGHAFVGCWLEEETFEECVEEDTSAITKRMADGMQEIAVVECTDFVAGKEVDFDTAERHARAAFGKPEYMQWVLDIARTRVTGVRPMPVRIVENGQIRAVSYGERNDGDITSAPKEFTNFAKLEPAAKIPVTKQKIWERKLLDLSLRNTLLSFRPSKNAIQLMTSDLAMLEDEFSSGKDFKILPCPADWTGTWKDSVVFESEQDRGLINAIAENELKNHRFRTFMEEKNLESAMKVLSRNSKTRMEENGTNTMYLALGFLKWYEREISEKARYAPLILLPVDLIRRVQDKCFVIRLRDEEPQMNITLLEMLRQDFGIHIGGLDPLPEDERGIDLKLVFHTMRQAVLAKKGWDVREYAFLGIFSFSQFIMWNDIRNRSGDLKKNKVVKSLMEGKMEWTSAGDIAIGSLDETVKPSDMAVPASADSSQLAAICMAAKGESFVLHGPPGTGKSQTITNMIANAMYQGKSVLFVAEKMAALEVVQKRLEKIGLEPFCLELHSNKAQKRAVLSQLQRTLETGRLKEPGAYAEEADRLLSLRQSLNKIMEEIHNPRPYGMSLYETITVFEKNQKHQGRLKLPDELFAKAAKESRREWKELLSSAMVAARECGGVPGHVYILFEDREYSFEKKTALGERLESFRAGAEAFEKAYGAYCRFLGLNPDGDYEAFSLLRELADISLHADRLSGAMIFNLHLEEQKEQMESLLSLGMKKDERETRILAKFDRMALSYDAESALMNWRLAETQWILSKMTRQKKLLKELQALARNPKSVTKEHYPEFAGLIAEYRQLVREIERADQTLTAQFVPAWGGVNSDWEECRELLNKSLRVQQLMRALTWENATRPAVEEHIRNAAAQIKEYADRNRSVLTNYIKAYDSCMEQEAVLRETHHIRMEELHRRGWFGIVSEQTGIWQEHLDELRAWTGFLLRKDAAANAGLATVMDALCTGRIAAEDLVDCFECNLALGLALKTIRETPALRNFQGSQMEATIETYRSVLRDFEVLTIKELAARLSARIPVTSGASSSEVAVLQKAIKSGARGMSIRKLFDSIPNLLHQICPCMLMSPISVAQYIDPSYPKFDLVIFDEASQMPTCEAVGAIARGENVVVVGDPKQLPPTSFFQGNRLDEDNLEKEDLESLLDDCLALAMPQKHLLWHYRSRHESLIAYSNRQYYDNRLYTFPSPNDQVSQVVLIPVDGYYDRGGTKQNEAEAKAVVAEVIRRLSDSRKREESIGIVTFSIVQRHLIEDLMEDAFREHPDLYQYSQSMEEPLFIKNLENVQGDERDVILFSVGYGPDKNGKVTMNFGPLNQDGGWRRLNVAISRARKRMQIYSVLRPEQISLSRTGAEGIIGLKGFLEFAALGTQSLTVRSGMKRERNLIVEKQIAEQLHFMGYEVKVDVGCSAYHIDLAVVHPKKADNYILGVMCDGDSYRMAGTSRDRNLLQPSVLQGLGWNLHRVWVLDWMDNPNKELKKIAARIRQILKEEEESELSEKSVQSGSRTAVSDIDAAENKRTAEAPSYRDVTFEKEEQTVNARESIYQIADIRPYMGKKTFSATDEKRLLQCLNVIVETEGPVSRRLIVKRICSAWQIRLTAKTDAMIGALLERGGFCCTKTGGNDFYWKSEKGMTEWNCYRVSALEAEKRSMDDISKEEVSAAIEAVLEEQISIAGEELVKETAKKFGYSRTGSVIEASVKEGLQFALNRGTVELIDNGNRIRLSR